MTRDVLGVSLVHGFTLYMLQYQTKKVMDLVCSMSVIYCTVPLILR